MNIARTGPDGSGQTDNAPMLPALPSRVPAARSGCLS